MLNPGHFFLQFLNALQWVLGKVLRILKEPQIPRIQDKGSHTYIAKHIVTKVIYTVTEYDANCQKMYVC
jgi:hypothetical protein